MHFLALLLAFLHCGESACPPTFHRRLNSCFFVGQQELNWFNADRYCTYFTPPEYKVHLASIENVEKQIEVEKLVRQYGNGDGGVWVSGNRIDQERGWYWSRNNSAMRWFNWAPGEPNNSGMCVQMYPQLNFKWDDTDCRHGKQFVCEIENS